MLQTLQRFKSERHNVLTEETDKIALSSNAEETDKVVLSLNNY